jgi:hypothetical protein
MTKDEIESIIAKLVEAIEMTRQTVNEAREVAEHARASSVQTEAMHKALMPAVIQLQQDVGGFRAEMKSVWRRFDELEIST